MTYFHERGALSSARVSFLVRSGREGWVRNAMVMPSWYFAEGRQTKTGRRLLLWTVGAAAVLTRL